MPHALTIPPRVLAAVALAAVLAGCQPGANTHPVPSVAQIGGDLKCSAGDHGYEDAQAGWGFCYPDSWKYTERSQASQAPPGLDLTFDITYVPATPAPCASPEASGASPAAPVTPCAGAFAFMIISTYDRGGAANLSEWVAGNLPKTATVVQPIAWGNAVEAARLSDGRRLALTQHHVVILELHSGLLDLESEMAPRLDTWKFTY